MSSSTSPAKSPNDVSKAQQRSAVMLLWGKMAQWHKESNERIIEAWTSNLHRAKNTTSIRSPRSKVSEEDAMNKARRRTAVMLLRRMMNSWDLDVNLIAISRWVEGPPCLVPRNPTLDMLHCSLNEHIGVTHRYHLFLGTMSV